MPIILPNIMLQFDSEMYSLNKEDKNCNVGERKTVTKFYFFEKKL